MKDPSKVRSLLKVALAQYLAVHGTVMDGVCLIAIDSEMIDEITNVVSCVVFDELLQAGLDEEIDEAVARSDS